MKVEFVKIDETLESDLEKLKKIALSQVNEVLTKARKNKNCIKWLNGEEIKHIGIKLVNWGVGDIISYHLNEKVGCRLIKCSGNSLEYYKFTFWKV